MHVFLVRHADAVNETLVCVIRIATSPCMAAQLLAKDGTALLRDLMQRY